MNRVPRTLDTCAQPSGTVDVALWNRKCSTHKILNPSVYNVQRNQPSRIVAVRGISGDNNFNWPDPDMPPPQRRAKKPTTNIGKTLAKQLQGICVYLVGLDGTRKSEIGRVLSASLGYQFISVDEVMIEAAKQSGSSLAYWRQDPMMCASLEAATIEKLEPRRRAVIAVGSEAVENTRNWAAMRQGVVVQLYGTYDVLAKRAIKDGEASEILGLNPELSEADAQEWVEVELEVMYNELLPMYDEADVSVSVLDRANTDEAEAGVVAGRVIQAVLDNIEMNQRAKDQRKNFKMNQYNINKAP